MLSWLKKDKTEASESCDHNCTTTSSNTGRGHIQNANCGIVTESTVTSSDIAIKTFSNIIAVPCGSENGSKLTSYF